MESSLSGKRLQRELASITSNPPPLCSAGLRNSDLYDWTATIMGPPGTPYEGGAFKLSVKFNKNYPLKPPMVRFTTQIYHCNVAPNGAICLDILGAKWSPALTVSGILMSVQSLLTDPNPNSPLRGDIAVLYRKNRKEHDAKAKEWTAKYAIPPVSVPTYCAFILMICMFLTYLVNNIL